MPGQPPKSYDEIARQTVPDPEGSWRPTVDQERDAHEGGFRALDAGEQAIYDGVRDALVAAGVDTSRIAIEVHRDRVTLRGTVGGGQSLAAIEDTVSRVAGVSDVVDWLVIE